MKSTKRCAIKIRGQALPLIIFFVFVCRAPPLPAEETQETKEMQETKKIKETRLVFLMVEPNLNYVSALGMTAGYYNLTTPRIFVCASMLIVFGRPASYALSGNVFIGYSFPLFERFVYGFAFIPGVFIEFHKPDYYYHNAVNAGIGIEITKFFVLSKRWRLALAFQTAVSFIPANEVIVHIKPSFGAAFAW